MSFVWHHPNYYKKLKADPKESIKVKTKSFSWSEPLDSFDVKSFENDWKNVADHVRSVLKEDLVDPSAYERIDVDAERGRLYIHVWGVKPKLWKYFKETRGFDGEEEDE